jgi:YggT family protein
VASLSQTYLLLLFLRVLLSWFPAFNWERQPWLTLRQMTDPYLQLFRGLIPPLLGMIDFTPLLGFFILQWIHGELASATMEDDIEEYW